ncbi:anti-sigma-K factor RskA [Sphaerotilus hippei]|uniref:Anti-sigma-K factor RskA n=1 Tax=Sphaerotilus hippei TaxID=744406 RepID=A0A318H0P3_9BURK|nr:anti-sigma factor [Sphaerotilus hippei]PXW96543.1 anti-sigma-K factor RskA [Sphaerotilus hippei]
MDYSRPELAQRLAAEYVVGTLHGGARRRFESLLPAHPGLRQAVWQWQDRLMPLTASVPPVPPSPRVWAGIQSTLFAPPASGEAGPWWQRLRVWQGLCAAAGACSLALLVALGLPAPVQPPVVVVMNSEQGPATFVASVSADGRSLVLKPLGGMALSATQALELWAVPPQGAPRSLGLVSAQGATTVRRAELLQGTAAFAVSIEPPGGSPTGAPTGPVVSAGKLEL